MPYTALYRKYRPLNFSDVSGQESAVATLRNQCAFLRVGHAYLFCGTRGTGKTTLAKIMARAVNCLNPKDGEPCNECSICLDILQAKSTDVIELDAASHNGVDSIRRITDEVSYTPTNAKFRVYIIDEAHMLSSGAFNALLKTLEEPPSYCIFILATTEAHKLPVTIMSRCQRYDFRKLTREQIFSRVRFIADKEGLNITDEAILEISGFADGAVRDALSILERCITLDEASEINADNVRSIVGAADVTVFEGLLNSIFDGEPATVLAIFDKAIISGLEPQRFADDFCAYLRNALLIKTAISSAQKGGDYKSALNDSSLKNIIDMPEDSMLLLADIVAKIPVQTLMRYLRVISELPTQLRYSQSKRILCEVALIKLCKPEMESDYSSVLDRVRVLEGSMEKMKLSVSNGDVYAPTNLTPPTADAKAAEQREYLDIERKLLQKALPDDVKKLAADWGAILNSYGRHSKPAAMLAQKAKLSLDSGGGLALAFIDPIAADYFNDKSNLEALQAFVQNSTKKDIRLKVFEVSKAADANDGLLNLDGIVNMEIDYTS